MQSARFGKELLSAKEGGIRSGWRIGASWGGLNFFYSCLYALALWFGGHVLMSENGAFQPNDVVICHDRHDGWQLRSQRIQRLRPVMARAIVSFRAMKEVMKSEPTAKTIEQPLYSSAAMPEELCVIDSVEFRAVSFRYPTRPEKCVLNDFRLSGGEGPEDCVRR